MSRPCPRAGSLLTPGRRRVRVALLGLAALLLPLPAGAQSAYVPLDDVAYAYVDALIARGQLRTLSLLDRPYTVRRIREALAADTRPAPPRRRPDSRPAPRRAATAPAFPQDVIALRSRLERAIARYDFAPARRTAPGAFRAEASASVWLTGETSGQRELMLGDEQDPNVFFGGAARLLMTAGPVVAFARPILDNRLNTDPDFHGRKDRRIAGRNEDGYVAGQWRYGELFFGRMARNWGPAPLQGLLLSPAPYTYEHLFGRLGTQRLMIDLVLARLDSDELPDNRRIQRYLASHRLAGRWRGLEFALAESYVYSGEGRGFEPTLANPFTIYALTWRNDQQEGNLLGSAQVAARTRYGVFSGELLIDDLQIDRCDTLCEQPSSYGLTFTAEGLPLPWGGGQRAFVGYTRVAALTYRNKTLADRYTMFDVSLGRAFSDYEEWRVGVDLVAWGVPLRPYLAHRRQGEGDYRKPFPPPEEWPTHPGIFEGEMTRIGRLGLAGGAVFGSFDVKGDIGYNWVDHTGPLMHDLASGQLFRPRVASFEGRVRVAFHPSWARVRLAP